MPSQVGMRARKLFAAGLIVVMGTGLAACGDGDDEIVGGASDDADLVITENREFQPRTLKIRANQESTITIANQDDEVHNFTLSFLEIDKDVPPNQTITVTIPASAAPRDGVYGIRCKFPGHQAEGEYGQIEVVED